MPRVLDAPAITHVLHQSFGSSTQTRDVLTHLIERLALSDPLAAQRQYRGAARPVLHHPRRGGHPPQRPGVGATAFAFTLVGLPRRVAAIGQPVLDHLRSFAATLLYSDQEVGATLLEVEKKGRFACSASACTSKPLRSTRSNSWRKAAISPPASVA